MKICLVLNGKSLIENSESLASQRAWIDMAEVRADCLDSQEWPALAHWSREQDLPLVLTLRRPEDGGFFRGSNEEQKAFFRSQREGRWAWWDLEIQEDLEDCAVLARRLGIGVIRSQHDFQGVPADIPGILDRLSQGGALPKLAVTLKDSRDFLAFVQECRPLVEEPAPQERILLAMGELGAFSRIAGARWNSAWTYAALPGQQVAPGQFCPQELKELYRVPRFQAADLLYGIMGNPVSHSKSPLIHNRALAALDLPGAYVRFPASDWEPHIRGLALLGVRGLSVTIPFKVAAAESVGANAGVAVQGAGACNTLYWPDSANPGRPRAGLDPGDEFPHRGENTDAPGFREPLEEALGQDWFAGRRALVIGSGGAARGAAWSLLDAGMEVEIRGRNGQKCQSLAQELGCGWSVLEASSQEDRGRFDLVVQSTNVGMGDMAGQNPVPDFPWTGKEVAYEIIYVPAMTPFLEAARGAGCRIFLGREMLLHQAYHQFRLFTGREYPRDCGLEGV